MNPLPPSTTAWLFPLLLLLGSSPFGAASACQNLKLAERAEGAKPRNVVLILTDDQRYDAVGFLNPFLETPAMDRLAREGVHFENAMVTTSLCSPSRASILTGQYAHAHRVVDNHHPVPEGTVFFPQYLQNSGYRTAFVGKWHMGRDSDDPQPGFDHWVSFRGQGSYTPGPNTTFNVNGEQVPQTGYITDELTDYAVDWLEEAPSDQPFFLYLSHKAVHSHFRPAERHQGRYAQKPVDLPLPPDTDAYWNGKPMWVQNQRDSYHGMGFMYQYRVDGLRDENDLATLWRRYMETLLAVDESIARVLQALEKRGQLDSTIVIFTSDNGSLFGDHGLIDKRNPYEPSIRVPLLMRCPELFPAGSTVPQVVANIDLGPSILAAANLETPAQMHGSSFLELAQGKSVPWRKGIIYEYFWERTAPHTPTLHALRTDRYKYIRPYGLWDLEELYDLRSDPHELENLIHSPEHRELTEELNQDLFAILKATDGMQIPLSADRTMRQNNLRPHGKRASAPFPAEWEVPKNYDPDR